MGPHGEMDPVAPVPVLFDKEFVIILLNLFRVCYQYRCILYRLLDATTANIHGTASQVIARTHATDFLVEFRTAIAAINYNRCTCPISQHLQPSTYSLHVLNGYVTRNISFPSQTSVPCSWMRKRKKRQTLPWCQMLCKVKFYHK